MLKAIISVAVASLAAAAVAGNTFAGPAAEQASNSLRSSGAAFYKTPQGKLVFSNDNVEQLIELNDGAVVYVFKDGKMGMVDKEGWPLSMQSGHPMQSKDGRDLIMNGNEVGRVYTLLGKYPAN